MKRILLSLTCSTAILVWVSACGEFPGTGSEQSQAGNGSVSYWQEKDEFADAGRSYLDGSYWINEDGSEFLDLQFQCIRSQTKAFAARLKLVAISSVDSEKDERASSRFFSALLFRVNDGPPTLYRLPAITDLPPEVIADMSPDIAPEGSPVGPFQSATFDLDRVIAESGVDQVRQLRLRFIYGASPLSVEMGNVQDLSQSPAIDVTLDATDQKNGKVLRDCYPRADQQ